LGASDRERRLLTAALHLMLAEEARGLAMEEAISTTTPSPLRSCVLGTMAFASGQLGIAERMFSEALAGARLEGGDRTLAALVANRLAGTFTLLGEGQKVMDLALWALETGCLDAAADSQTRTLLAIGASQVGGARVALHELRHLDPDPSRVASVHVDGLSFRGVFHLLAGDLPLAVADLAASLRMVRSGATITLGLRAYCDAALAQYLSGAWDEALLTVEQGFSLAGIHSRQFELPLLHLAAGVVPAGRGVTADAERHAHMAAEAAATLDYGQERLHACMARAMVCQASADHAGIAAAMGDWLDDAVLDGRTQLYAILWRPLLVEGLIGSGRLEDATSALRRLEADGLAVRFLGPALAWLGGWLAESKGDLKEAELIYQQGHGPVYGSSPVYAAHLMLAHGRLLRRTGRRRLAVEPLRQALDLYGSFGAAPFVARTEEELVACGLSQASGPRRSVLALTDRETEIAHLIGRGMTNSEIAGELYVTPKAVEYHLGNIYAKVGVKGRQQLRRSLTEGRQSVSL
jgi:ATP/maltotriose-dependent transcriptional regulator MalT